MKPVEAYLLLHIIKNDKSIAKLIYEGYSYIDVAKLIKQFRSENLIVEKSNNLVLTEKGEKTYSELAVIHKKTSKNEWIQRDKKNMIEKTPKDFIFVPNQNELTFLDE